MVTEFYENPGTGGQSPVSDYIHMPVRVGVSFGSEQKAAPYLAALHAVDLAPVPLTPGMPPEIAGLEGLVLTGGTDLNPSLYGAVRDPATLECDDARDAFEVALLQRAFAVDLPVLAICRGMQMLNVACGGTLIQDIKSEIVHRRAPGSDERPGRHGAVHEISVKAASGLAALVGVGRHAVNSRHHQALDRVGEGLTVSAVADDGIAEACERRDKRFVIAVQWHPEDRIDISEPDRKLFEAFREAAAGRFRFDWDHLPGSGVQL